MTFDPLMPFNSLPDLPPNVDIETKQVLKKTVAAGRALAAFQPAIHKGNESCQ